MGRVMFLPARIWLGLLLVCLFAGGAYPAPDEPPPGKNDTAKAQADATFGFLEQYLQKELARRLGPAASYEVHFDRDNSDIAHGKLGSVDVTGTDIQTTGGLKVAHVEIHMDSASLRLDGKPDGDAPEAQFTARIDRRDLNQFLRARVKAKVEDLHLTLDRGTVTVHGKPEVLGVQFVSEVEGKLVLRSPHVIEFQAQRAKAAGIKIPKQALQVVEKRFNPIVDISRIRLPIHLERITVRKDELTLFGTADFSKQTSGNKRPDAEKPGDSKPCDPDQDR